MIRSRRLAALALSLMFAGGVLAVPAQAATPAPPAPLTPARIGQMAPAQQDKLLEPLRAVAKAVGEVGRGKEAATYSGLVLDPVNGKVDLYLTDLARLPNLLAAADKAGRYDHRLVRAHQARYSKRTLRAARERVFAKRHSFGFNVNSIAIPSQGTGLKVGIADNKNAPPTNLAAPSQVLAETGGVPVAVGHATAKQGKSRWASGPIHYSGAYIKTSMGGCSSGLTVHNSKTTYLVTAAHCGHLGTVFRNGNDGWVGKVISVDLQWDAALIDARSIQREWDGPRDTTRWFNVTGSGYSYNGDYVCQNGWTSGIVCGIRVTDDDDWANVCDADYGCHWARGVNGNTSSGTAVRGGDSGALVFCYCAGKRPARGLVSAGNSDPTHIFFTEAPDILKSFGMSMH